jgi:hypothetical protein
MKKMITCALFMGIFAASQAQGNDSLRKYDPEMDVLEEAPTETMTLVDYKSNIAKLNVTSLLFKNVSLQYERILTKRMSVALGLRIMPKSSLPFSNAIENSIGNDDEETLKLIQDMRIGGFAITPEFRYYVGKGYGKGFYLAPYVRYQKFTIESSYLFTDENNEMQAIDFKGDYNNFGIGLMIGSQFKLAKNITLDWWIIGPQYGSNNMNIAGSGFQLSDEDVKTLRDDITDIEILGMHPEVEISNTHANIKANKGFWALRGFGICIGFQF